MLNHNRDLFSESAFGGLASVMPGSGSPALRSATGRHAASNAASPRYVETLGLPRATPPLILAQVLEDIHATAPDARLDRLYRPGVLSRLFSQSAAEASYAMAILAIVESAEFHATVAQLRSC